MNKSIVSILALSALVFSLNANADFVQSDWLTENDNRATLHEETGLEWLKIDNTGGYSINDVTSDADFAGWRIPTSSEVQTIMSAVFTSINFDEPNKTMHTNGTAAEVDKWFEVMGLGIETDISNEPNKITYGYHWDGSQSDVVFSGLRSYSNTYVFDNYASSNYNADRSHAFWGVFLVSDGGTTLISQGGNASASAPSSDVPILFISLFSLAGLLVTRRKA
jgi:hypothetical protein